MNILKQLIVTRGARADARLGLTSAEDRIVAELGPRPQLDQKNHEHAALAATLADRTKVQELKEDIAAAEDSLAAHPPPFLLTLGLVFTIGVEFVGAVLILRALGVPPNERLPLGLALSFALLGITAVLARRTSAAPATAGESPVGAAPPKTPGRSAATFIILLAYSALVAAFTVLRISSSTDEDASDFEIIASSFVLLAASIGPAWMAEWLLRLRAPSVALRKRLRTLRRRLGLEERAHGKAKEKMTRIDRDGARWDVEAARRRAQYATEHRLEDARQAERKRNGHGQRTLALADDVNSNREK